MPRRPERSPKTLGHPPFRHARAALQAAGRVLGVLTLAVLLAACAAKPGPALWRLADADTTIWLFGSIHVLPNDIAWRSKQVDEAFGEADTLVLEADVSPAAQQNILALAERHGSLPAGQALLDQLNEEDTQRLQAIADQLGVPMQALQTMRPWRAALVLVTLAAEAAGHTAAFGVEEILRQDAQQRGLAMDYLETAESQLLALAELSPDDERRFLSATLTSIEAGAAKLNAMDAAWANGDVDSLTALLMAEFETGGPALYNAVIVNRNQAWTEALIARLDEPGTVFVAVGAAHLVGADSVVAMLRARGFDVEGPDQ